MMTETKSLEQQRSEVRDRRSEINARLEVITDSITAWTYWTDELYTHNRICEQEEIIAQARENIARFQSFANRSADEIIALTNEQKTLESELATLVTPKAPKLSEMTNAQKADYYRQKLAELEALGAI